MDGTCARGRCPVSRLPRRCLDCGQLTGTGSRCPEHAAQARANRPTRRGYTHAERNRRAATVAAWVQRWGDWCPGWGTRTAHPVQAPNVLTADHAIPGDQTGELVVLCRDCNASKSDKGLNVSDSGRGPRPWSSQVSVTLPRGVSGP
jgi:5-methylcytosine-specific restriction protein A